MSDEGIVRRGCCCGESCSPKKTLTGFFNPRGIAVVGASSNPAKIGYQIMHNLTAGGYAGTIYPINPKDETILGCKAYKSVTEIPGAVDLAVITIPAPGVIPVMEECGRKGIKNVAIITSGFAEVGNVADEKKIKEIADTNGIAFLGPNILGLLYMPTKINASFGPQDLLPGKIAFISQSGALAIALMGWTVMEKIGLAAMCSLGNKADVDERDLVEYFNDDPNIDVMLIYMEGLKQARKFLGTKTKKPVIVLKVGCSQRGAKAAASHTGSLAGADGIYEGVFKQLGMLRARNFTEAFGWARAFSLPVPEGNDALIITNGGGIGVSATDECEALGVHLLEDPQWLEGKFRSTMPDFGSSKNPIDITGQGHAKQYGAATNVALAESRITAVIVLYCETAVTDPLAIAKGIHQEYVNSGRKKPLVVAMVGGERSRQALQYLNENNVPAFGSVNETISALKILYTWKEVSQRKIDVPEDAQAPREVVEMINAIKAEGRNVLLEHEARRALELCGVPTPKWGFATNLDEALKMAEGMYPLAMKVASVDIIHKTDMGGVALNIRDEEELEEKYIAMMDHLKAVAPTAKIQGVNLIQMVKGIECIIGMNNDPQFGPVIMFGLGGVFVEALKDVAFRTVPFGKAEAERLVNDIKSKRLLDGFRGMKADKPTIINALCAVQKLAPLVREIDINPLMTSEKGSFAVDARIIL